MPKRLFDTNILIADFHQIRPFAGKTPGDAEERAKRLIKDREADAILSPVVVEFLCGVLDQHERLLREGYLRPFRVVDELRTLPQDWKEAQRIAKHPGFKPRPRDLGDCLIIAVAGRIHYEVLTYDRGLRRQQGRTS